MNTERPGMSYQDSNPNKRLAAALFIVAYLLPLSLLFLLSVVVIFNGWIGRLALILGFGLPLTALWVAVLKYHRFKRGASPFVRKDVRASLVLFALSQGVLLVTLAVIAPLLIKYLRGYPGMAEAPVFLVGLAGIPAALFGAAVLFKAWKERHSHPAV